MGEGRSESSGTLQPCLNLRQTESRARPYLQENVYLSSSHSWIVSLSVFAAKPDHIRCISGSTPDRLSGSALANKKRNESFTLKVLFWLEQYKHQ